MDVESTIACGCRRWYDRQKTTYGDGLMIEVDGKDSQVVVIS